MSLPKDVVRTNGSGPCVVCGEKTSFAEINYGVWMCSSGCLEEYSAEINAVLSRLGGVGLDGPITSDLESRVEQLEDEVSYIRSELEELQDSAAW
jgi:hypothetical protein